MSIYIYIIHSAPTEIKADLRKKNLRKSERVTVEGGPPGIRNGEKGGSRGVRKRVTTPREFTLGMNVRFVHTGWRGEHSPCGVSGARGARRAGTCCNRPCGSQVRVVAARVRGDSEISQATSMQNPSYGTSYPVRAEAQPSHMALGCCES